MKTYYKATRMDGTDFRTGTVDYAAALATGKPLKRLTSLTGYACCTDTVYHASDTPSETLIGGSWPCRLFEVTGRPVDQVGHKFGFRSLRVRREVEAWPALGPNGQEVSALIDEIRLWTPAQLGAARDAARDAAWGVARDAVWDTARDAARGAVWDAAGDTARSAARDAAEALVVRDLIEERHFNVLFAPVAAARGAE